MTINKQMRYLVIGGNGFVGSHVIDMLLSMGEEVVVLDRYPERFRSPNPAVIYHVGDFSDSQLLKIALKGIDTVIHLQSSTVPSSSEHNHLFDIESNLIPTVKLLEAMVQSRCTKIVYLSSGGAVYGNPMILPTPENSTINPISSYGVVKATIESYITYFHRYGIESLIVRPSNLYGIRQGNTGILGLINTLLEKALREEEVVIFGNGSAVKDYVHVSDLTHFLSLALKMNACGIFNIGSGIGVSVNEVIEIVENVTRKALQIRHEETRAFDVLRIILDIKKAKTEVGWSPIMPLNKGIKEVWQYKTAQ